MITKKSSHLMRSNRSKDTWLCLIGKLCAFHHQHYHEKMIKSYVMFNFEGKGNQIPICFFNEFCDVTKETSISKKDFTLG